MVRKPRRRPLNGEDHRDPEQGGASVTPLVTRSIVQWL
jgi:hypothetical protein